MHLGLTLWWWSFDIPNVGSTWCGNVGWALAYHLGWQPNPRVFLTDFPRGFGNPCLKIVIPREYGLVEIIIYLDFFGLATFPS